MIIDRDSLENPRLAHARRRSLQVLENRVRGKRVILIPAHSKPFNHQPEYLKLTVGQAGVGEGFEVLFIHPALGVFHPSLSPTYPFYQHEGGITRDVLNHKHLARLMDKLVEKAGARDLIVLESSWMSRELFERIRKYSRHGDKILIYSLGEISSLLARSP